MCVRGDCGGGGGNDGQVWVGKLVGARGLGLGRQIGCCQAGRTGRTRDSSNDSSLVTFLAFVCVSCEVVGGRVCAEGGK